MYTTKTVNSQTTSPWIPLDDNQAAFNVSVAVAVTGTMTYTVQFTLDNIQDPSVTPLAFDVPSLASKTASASTSLRSSVKAVRLNVTSYTSGSATIGVRQGTSWDGVGQAIDAHVALSNPHAQYLRRRSAPFENRVIAHRGGGLLMPENSMSAFRCSAGAGIVHIEMDCYVLADGAVGCIHDPTVDRTTTGTGAVASLSGSAFKALRLDPETYLGFGTWPEEGPPLLPEVLDMLAAYPEVSVWLEGKNTGATEAIVAELMRRAWPTDKAFVQVSAQADFTPVSAAGYGLVYVVNPMSIDIAAVAQLGVTHVAYYAFSAETISLLHAENVCAAMYTIDRQADADAAFALGLDFVFSDDPIWVAKRAMLSSASLFWGGRYAPGSIVSAGLTYAPIMTSGRLTWTTTVAAYVGQMQGWGCPVKSGNIAAGFVISFKLRFSMVNADDRWASVFICAATDSVFADAGAATLVSGYHLLVRRNGKAQIYKQSFGAAAVLLQETTGTTLALDTDYDVIATVTPTEIALKVGAFAENRVADAQYRGAFFHFGRSGAAVSFSSVRVS